MKLKFSHIFSQGSLLIAAPFKSIDFNHSQVERNAVTQVHNQPFKKKAPEKHYDLTFITHITRFFRSCQFRFCSTIFLSVPKQATYFIIQSNR